MKAIQIHPLSAVAGASALGLVLILTSGAQRTQLPAPGSALTRATPAPVGLTPEQERILSLMSIVHLDDGVGGTVETVRFTGVNVQIVNGLEATNGYPFDPDATGGGTETNGTGNLIVGYNEMNNPGADFRTGSHNVVVGQGQTYTSFGGLIAARMNSIRGAYACVSGGVENEATGLYASVGGGRSNVASGSYASVTGGDDNLANASWSSVTGGWSNQACGNYSTVSGGYNRHVCSMNQSGNWSYDWIGGSLWQDL